MGILSLLVGGSVPPPDRRQERASWDEVEVARQECREAEALHRRVQAENLALLEDAHRMTGAAMEALARVLSRRYGLDEDVVLRGPRHAIRERLAVVLSSLAELSSEVHHEAVDRHHEVVSEAVQGIVRLLDDERAAERDRGAAA